jgi:PPP family 3-phenylpropionic acid transporter
MRLDSASRRMTRNSGLEHLTARMTPFGFAPRLAAFYAAIFVLSGVQLPFFPVWLKAKGLDAGTIGLLLAMPMVVRVMAIPFAAREADRRDALRGAIMAASVASVAGFALLGLSSGVAALFFANLAVSLCFTPVMPLAEAYALKGLAARGRVYGPVRLWGSAAFILGTFTAGFAADVLAPRHLIWLIVVASALTALAALSLAPLSTGMPEAAGAPSTAPAPRVRLARDPAFLAMVAAASLIQASHAVYYGFSALAWRAEGFDGTTVGALWALGVAAEIVLFASQARLPAAATPVRLMMAGAIGAALRWGAMALGPPAAMLPLLQMLHALSFGATHLGALSAAARAAPAGQAATAQAYLAMALGAGMAGAIALSGWLYESFGNGAYAAMALAAIAGGICCVIAQRARPVVVA